MTLIELLSTLRSRDISVWADGERLRYSAASGALTPDIREELVKHKADLLTFLNETNRVRRVTHTPIAKIPREAELLPSINQRRLWFIDQLQPNTAFNCYKAFRIKGCLRIDSLDQSLNEIVRRHEVLRTTFPAVDGEPFQAIVPSLERGLSVIDLRDIVDATMRETEVKRIITEEAERPYDLAKGPLFRTHLLCLGTDEYLLLITMHHIVTDGWSMGILVKELTVLYEAFCKGNSSPLPELPVQYVDFAHWQSQRLQDEVLQQDLAYWKERLKGAPEVLELPTDRPRPAIQNYQGASEPVVISKGLTAALRTLSKNNGVTLFMTLLAALKTLLYRYTGQEDLMLGSPIAGRRRVEIENLIGLFINTLVLRTDLSGNPSFRELLRRVQEVALGAYAHQDVPFEKLIQELHLERSLSFTSLFQAMFVLQNTPESKLMLLDSTVSQITIDRETAFTDLFLSLTETDEGLQGALSYRTDLFLKSTITRMIAAFQVLLEGIVTDPDQAISTLPVLHENEKQQLLVEWNETTKDYPNDKCLHHLFEEQVERTPEAVAVVCQSRRLTYRELNRKANQLAHYLRKLGIRADVLVGICAERSLETIVGLLGILKAGGAYVPIDPQYPEERLAFLIRDARPSVLLTQQGLVTNLANHSGKIVYLDDEEMRAESAENPMDGATADSLAYVIYTSGSTGEPKGVMTTHRGICNRFLWGREAYKLTDNDRVLHAFSLSFDFATWEIFTALVSGAQLIIAEPGGHLDSGYLVKLIRSRGITLAGFVPAMLTTIFEETEIASCTSLKRVVSGGEVLPVEFQECFFSTLAGVELQNTYGPTEAAIDVTCWICEPENVSKLKRKRVPIGRPIANTQIYLLDTDLQPVPSGVSGEIYIGGAGLARGYLNRPDLTAEKFIANPFSNEGGGRLYKTGDLARYRRDGNIEFLGRMDNQVKIRGFRIELGEIEAAINQHAAVQASVAGVRDYTVEDKRLIAYVVPRQEGLTAKDLREFLKQKLPEYMVPSALVFLDALPLTTNGKLDRKALAALNSGVSEHPQGQLAPRDELELQLTKLWERVLKVRPIGIRDNFFDLGGHSLLAVRLFAQMEKIIDKELPLATLFRAPTIEQLAELIRQQQWSAPWKSLVAIQPGGSHPPFFCVHAHDGGVLFWRDLARHLGSNQPFYALQPQGLDGKEPLHTRIEEMAAHYVREVRSLQLEGPYYIGGHCIGGLIAFEMAHQLRLQGEKVGLLALFDSYAPRGESTVRRSVGYRYRNKAVRFFETVGLHMGNLSVLNPEERLPYLNGKFHKALYKLYMAIGWAETARQRRHVLHAATQAARSYQARVYPGKITLFRATQLRGSIKHDRQMGWGKFAGGEIETHLIPGYHAHIVLEPRVRVLARELTAALREAQEIGGGEPIVEGRASQQLQLSDRADPQTNAAVS